MVVERWTEGHERWAELVAVAEATGQRRNLEFEADWQLASHVLAALHGRSIAGLLRFVEQHIGPDNEQPPVRLGETPLVEAKVLAFGVVDSARRRGVGTRLQQEALAWARELGCYQLRSRSHGDSPENHQLKLKLGFAVHPVVRGEDKMGAYFVMPLRASDLSS